MSESRRSRLTRKWGWLTVALAMGITAVVLGYMGLGPVRPRDPTSSRIVNSLRLFALDAPTPTQGEANPWTLQIAQFLAPLSLTIFGLRITAPIYSKRLRLWWIRHRPSAQRGDNHSIVCGLSDAGMHIANALSRDKKNWVVVIEPSPAADRVAALQRSHILLLEGDASDPDTLTTAGISRADHVFITVADDGAAQKIRDAILDIDAPTNSATHDSMIQAELQHMHIRVRDLLVRRHLQIQAATEPVSGWAIDCFGVAEHAYDELYTQATQINGMFTPDEATGHSRPVFILGEAEHALDCALTIIARNHAAQNYGHADAGQLTRPAIPPDGYSIVIIGEQACLTVTRIAASLPQTLLGTYRLVPVETSGSLAELRQELRNQLLSANPTWVFVATEACDRLIVAEQAAGLCPETTLIAAAIDRNPRPGGRFVPVVRDPTGHSRPDLRRLWHLNYPPINTLRAVLISEYDELVSEPEHHDPNRLGFIDDLAHRRFRSYVSPQTNWDAIENELRAINREFVTALCEQVTLQGGRITLGVSDDTGDLWSHPEATKFDWQLRSWATGWWANRQQPDGLAPEIAAEVKSLCRGAEPDGLGASWSVGVDPAGPAYSQWFVAALIELQPPAPGTDRRAAQRGQFG